nr:DeoR/GlpR family DNA-binding transcription regulator [Mammaliicoccus sp. Marseille-Q6498]
MLKIIEERQQIIINHLKIVQFARIQDLIELVKYSEATVKRDLIELEKKGLVRRTRGGAMIIDNQKIDLPYLMKIINFNEQDNKHKLAEKAKDLINDDMIIFLDSSTTTLHLIKMLSKFEGLQIITNGVLTASLLSEFTDAQVNILGGTVVKKRNTINGSKAFNDALTYNADISFVSCRGFDLETGATETTEGEALIKQAFRKNSKHLVLIVTEEKYHNKYVHKSLSLRDIDTLVTDYNLTQDLIESLDKNNIKCIN